MTLDMVDFRFGQILENLSSLVNQKAAEKSTSHYTSMCPPASATCRYAVTRYASARS